MAQQLILTGAAANDKTGDTLRASFTKVNANFTELYSIGVQGTQGTEGAQGIQGITGIQGTQGVEGSQGAQGDEGAQGIQGITGIQGTIGQAGHSASYYSYKAQRSPYIGDPGAGNIIWNNRDKAIADRMNVSHLTSDGIDIDVFLALVKEGDIIVIQDAGNSDNYLTFTINGTETV